MGVDRDLQCIEIGIDIIDGADRTADFLGQTSRIECIAALAFDCLLGSLDQVLPELLASLCG